MRPLDPSRAPRFRGSVVGRLTPPQGNSVSVCVLDLSESGAFLETDLDLQVGDSCELALTLKHKQPWSTRCTVARLGTSQLEIRHPRVERVTVSRIGAGVTFDAIGDDALEALRAFLERLDEH
jgi:hypothetical protein